VLLKTASEYIKTAKGLLIDARDTPGYDNPESYKKVNQQLGVSGAIKAIPGEGAASAMTNKKPSTSAIKRIRKAAPSNSSMKNAKARFAKAQADLTTAKNWKKNYVEGGSAVTKPARAAGAMLGQGHWLNKSPLDIIKKVVRR